MRRAMLFGSALLLAVGAQAACAQRGGFGGGGFGGRGGIGVGGSPFGFRGDLDAPELPGQELDGPLAPGAAGPVLDLDPDQAARYAAAYDSFMVATRPQRDSARAAEDTMNDYLSQGDRVAAVFYAERLQRVGKSLKESQQRFEDGLDRLFRPDQIKAYRRWKKGEETAAAERRREEALRWRGVGVGGVGRFGVGDRLPGERPGPTEEPTLIDTPAAPVPELGAQAVRVGRSLFIAAQVAEDSTGAVVGGDDLGAQARRAFANLIQVLEAARASKRDVVRLTIYVVDYQSARDLPVIRDAAGAFLAGPRPPIATLLGVQSLARPGLLVAVEATAVTSGSDQPRLRDR